METQDRAWIIFNKISSLFYDKIIEKRRCILIKKISDIINLTKKIEDPRQKKKVKYPLNEVVGMVLFASLGNANEWTEIEIFCNSHEEFLRKYFKMENGVPSHDTIQRVIRIINPKVIQQL